MLDRGKPENERNEPPPPPLKRDDMTPTLQNLHRYRWWLIAVACSGVTLGLVVLGGECVYRLGGAHHWFCELHHDVRF